MTNQFERPMEVTKMESLAVDVATVLTPRPLPPGSRVTFNVAEVALHAKVVAIQKRGDTLFAVTVRVNNVSKEDREKLLHSFSG
ncbi:MAG: hypothetical protein JXX29_11280 [Deltaproteobacteria bacterium]|nr:hypothetical protein [Deltaproteobacteria bacterium]MBN2672253.1 hypothetical protein [Deltaproteobacteria bacterium]